MFRSSFYSWDISILSFIFVSNIFHSLVLVFELCLGVFGLDVVLEFSGNQFIFYGFSFLNFKTGSVPFLPLV